MPIKKKSPTVSAATVMANCAFENQCVTWLMQDGWQVFTPVLDHGHKVDLLISDGVNYYPIQVKTIELAEKNSLVRNMWKGSQVKYVIYFAKNSSWGYIIPAFTTNKKKLSNAGGQKFEINKQDFLKAFHLVP